MAEPMTSYEDAEAEAIAWEAKLMAEIDRQREEIARLRAVCNIVSEALVAKEAEIRRLRAERDA